MKLLIDANILLDVLQRREPFVSESSLVWKACEAGQDEGILSALTLANLVYVMRRELNPERTEAVLKALGIIFSVTELGAADLRRAAELRWPDFEDAVQSVTAQRLGADYIITRNIRDFAESRVPAMTPSEWLEETKRVTNI